MESTVFSATGMRHGPVALLWTDEKLAGATEFKPGRWGCVMWLFAAAARGRTAVASRESYGCIGGGVGLGFGNLYERWPGGVECFHHFLSCGNDRWARGREAAEQVRPYLREESFHHFVHGERYLKSPELVETFIGALPICDVPERFAVFKPLAEVDPAVETPAVVTFVASADQIAALVILSSYARESNESLFVPQAAGCQSIGIYPLAEARRDEPRAVLGLVDISARKNLRPHLGADVMTVSVPWTMFLELEGNVAGSFLEQSPWTDLLPPDRA